MEGHCCKYMNRLPIIGFGTYSLHGRVLHESINIALSSGIVLFDTAYKYGNEFELSSIINTCNSAKKIFLQTKVSQKQLLGTLSKLRLDKKNVKKSYRTSCSNLNTKIDVYLIHSYFDGCEKYYKKLIDLQNEEKIPYIGICNVGIEQLKLIKNITGQFPMIIQVEIHPYNSQKRLIDFCHSNNIIIEARSPFAHGDVMQEWINNDKLSRLSKYYDKTIPQLILRWLVQQNVIPIYRSKNSQHIKENVEIFDFEISTTHMSMIDELNKNISFGFVSKNNYML